MPGRSRNGETHVEERHTASTRPHGGAADETANTGSLTTTALVLGGVALLQPEWIAGMAVGAGVAMLSGQLPKIAGALRPAVKAAVQMAYSAVEVVAQAAEEVQDMVAEARAEREQVPPKQEPSMTH